MLTRELNQLKAAQVSFVACRYSMLPVNVMGQQDQRVELLMHELNQLKAAQG